MGLLDKIREFKKKRPVWYWLIVAIVIGTFIVAQLVFWAGVVVAIVLLIQMKNKRELKEIEEVREENERKMKGK